jgi:hypothetical protein
MKRRKGEDLQVSFLLDSAARVEWDRRRAQASSHDQQSHAKLVDLTDS